MFGQTDNTDAHEHSQPRTHARTQLRPAGARTRGLNTVNVGTVSSIMHRHFMFMQFTGQDRATDTVCGSLTHSKRIAIYKPITERTQT